jgi:hypothetical protein
MNTHITPFTGSAEEELRRLYDELQISDVVDALRGKNLPDQVQALIVPLTTTILDLFGTGTPAIGMDPISTLKSASRDINLSRILRERGLFRLYRLLNTNDERNIPLYQSLTDPDTGEPFDRREDLIGWFCKSARVSRSVVFMRMATIDKLLGLGFDLDDCYATVLTKPQAIRETLRQIADWEVGGELAHVDPDVAIRLAEKYLPLDEQEKVAGYARKMKSEDPAEQDEAEEGIVKAVRPAIGKLVSEVAAHDNTKDVMAFVRSDIAGLPEIAFTWDYEHDELECEIIIKGNKGGTEYVRDIITTRFIPDNEVHPDLRRELTTRLPIKNRYREE